MKEKEVFMPLGTEHPCHSLHHALKVKVDSSQLPQRGPRSLAPPAGSPSFGLGNLQESAYDGGGPHPKAA